MRIKKTSNTRALAGKVVNVNSGSTTDAYSCDYINDCNTYSTSETFTGKYWINGKKIYRKYISVQNPSQISGSGKVDQDFPHGIANVDEITEIPYAIFADNDNLSLTSNVLRFPVITSVGNPLAIYKADRTNIVLRSYNEGWSTLWHLKAVVEYTKTTD